MSSIKLVQMVLTLFSISYLTVTCEKTWLHFFSKLCCSGSTFEVFIKFNSLVFILQKIKLRIWFIWLLIFQNIELPYGPPRTAPILSSFKICCTSPCGSSYHTKPPIMSKGFLSWPTSSPPNFVSKHITKPSYPLKV